MMVGQALPYASHGSLLAGTCCVQGKTDLSLLSSMRLDGGLGAARLDPRPAPAPFDNRSVN
jgi:hypothetical protein